MSVETVPIGSGLDGEPGGEKKEAVSEEDDFFKNLMKKEEETIDVPTFFK